MLKHLTSFISVFLLSLMLAFSFAQNAYAGKDDQCKQSTTYNGAGVEGDCKKVCEISSGYGIVSNGTIVNICTVNQTIDFKVSEFLLMGDALACFATHAGAKRIRLLTITLFKFPHLSILISGCAIWILGAILTLVIGFYLIDISFKIGFALLALPIGIALWPFKQTSKKLYSIIKLMMNSTGVFIFLSLGASFAVALFNAAFAGVGGLDGIYSYINEGKTQELSEAFTVVSINFLLYIFAGVCGFRMLGKFVNDYNKKFFPDDTSLGNANPMHHRLTQAMDFAGQKIGHAAKSAASYAGDVAATQAKRGAAHGINAVGKGVQKAGHFAGYVAGDIKNGTNVASQKLAEAGKNLGEVPGNIARGAGAAVGKIAKDISDSAGTIISNAGGHIGDNLKTIGRAMQSAPLGTTMTGAAIRGACSLRESAGSGVSTVSELTGKVAKAAGSAVETMAEGAGDTVSKAVDSVAKPLGEAAGKAAGEETSSFTESANQSTGDKTKKVLDKVGHAASTAGEFIGNKTQGLVDRVEDKYQNPDGGFDEER